jgi:hypothetical protein
MSAGGLSYSGLRTSAKVTLPSVDSWNTNMNILKDPVKSVFTRRKDKVGDTQEILLAQEDSGDRIAECINVYARGVNPMVSVSYDNYGTNAGMRSSISQKSGGVKLPYKPEVFYPPVFRQEDLVPLSRQPRVWFYALTNPEVPNVVQEMKCPETKSSILPSKTPISTHTDLRYKYDKPVEILSPPSHSIQHNKKRVSNHTNPSFSVFTPILSTSSKQVREKPLHFSVLSSKKSSLPLRQNLLSSHPKHLKAVQKRPLSQSISSKSWTTALEKDMDHHPKHLDSKYLNHKKLRYPVHSSLSSLPRLSKTQPPKITSSIQSILPKESLLPNQQRLDSSDPWIHSSSSKIPSLQSKTYGQNVVTNKQSLTKPSPWIFSQETQQKRNLPSYQIQSSAQSENSYNLWYQDTEQMTGVRDDLMSLSTEGTHVFPEKNEWSVITPLETIGQQKQKHKIHVTDTQSIFHKDLQPPSHIYDETTQSTHSRHHTYPESRSHGQFEPHQQSIPSMDRMYDYASQKATHNKQTELRQKANSFLST